MMNNYYRTGVLLGAIFCLWASIVEGKVQVTTIPYSHGDVPLEGVLAWDDAIEGKRPGILIVHEWWGLDEYTRTRAKQLAGLGYVALAVDMYGKGKVTTHADKAKEWMQQITANVEMWQARALAGLRVLQDDSRVDSSRMAAIGYCFGGATVMQMVYAGAPVQGVVSFHGSLPLPPSSQALNSSAKILIAHGAADPFLTQDHLTQFTKALEEAEFDWQMVIYGGAQHSFTNPSADQFEIQGIRYQEQADRRSWEHMKVFFDDLFR
jgi:dienelactone hydrolase